MERRFTRGKAEIREGDSPVITGHAAVFYRADDPGTEFQLWEDTVERIMPGTFDRAVRDDDVRGLKNHNMDNLLARTTSGTLRLSVDSKGLPYEIDPPDSELGRSTVESIRRGDLDGSSFAFQLPLDGDTWRKEDGIWIRELVEVDPLFDVGPVTFPAFLSATSGVRSGDDNADAQRSFERFIRGSGRSVSLFRRRLRFAEMTAGNWG